MTGDEDADDLTKLPLDELPNTDAGAIEERRRALEDAWTAFSAYYADVDGIDHAALLEMLAIAIEEKAEREGIDLHIHRVSTGPPA